MLTKHQVLQAVEGAEKLASAIGQSTTEVLRKAMNTERHPTPPANVRAFLAAGNVRRIA